MVRRISLPSLRTSVLSGLLGDLDGDPSDQNVDTSDVKLSTRVGVASNAASLNILLTTAKSADEAISNPALDLLSR